MAATGAVHVDGWRSRRMNMRTAPGRPMPMMMMIVNHAAARKHNQRTSCEEGLESRDPG